ncbi:MAG: hypothetical protein D3923_12585, partial [Candidatus Electrothrix sp. AR3]|nr:hypothetical protein [Candidatus Electrothrix sp. AR3]
MNRIGIVKYCGNALVVSPLILLLFLPLIQMKYKLIPVQPLAGVESKQAEMIPFTYSDWLTGKYRQHLS